MVDGAEGPGGLPGARLGAGEADQRDDPVEVGGPADAGHDRRLLARLVHATHGGEAEDVGSVERRAVAVAGDAPLEHGERIIEAPGLEQGGAEDVGELVVAADTQRRPEVVGAPEELERLLALADVDGDLGAEQRGHDELVRPLREAVDEGAGDRDGSLGIGPATGHEQGPTERRDRPALAPDVADISELLLRRARQLDRLLGMALP